MDKTDWKINISNWMKDEEDAIECDFLWLTFSISICLYRCAYGDSDWRYSRRRPVTALEMCLPLLNIPSNWFFFVFFV